MSDNNRENRYSPEALKEVYDALKEKGYEPFGQIIQYIVTGNPSYITRYKEARDIITSQDKEVVLRDLVNYLHHVDQLAFIDSLTNVKNKSAYTEKVNEIKHSIENNQAKFTVAVFDINDLKKVNDIEGHQMGDLLICDAASLLKSVYGEENVYRVGGDEFVAILVWEEDMAVKFKILSDELERFNALEHQYSVRLAIAMGMSSYQAGDSYETVFNRADENMYKHKRLLKGENGVIR